MASATILVVDDEAVVRWPLNQRFTDAGYRVVEAETARQAFERLEDGADVVLLDYKLPDSDGLSVLKRVKEQDPDLPVIMLTGHATIDRAVEVMKQGAYHYAVKPFDLDELAMLVEKALETTRLRREVRHLRARQSEPYAFDRIIGSSPAMTAVKTLLRKVAVSPASTVLLTGESGTGKDLAAKVIHYNSSRASGPFMNITCSALPEQLLESELFGHERGAFTDAKQQKRGLLEQADGGTVFLDEIGEMVPALQVKLLRFLEERAFKRVGGTIDIRVDVRVIAATNRDLDEAVRQGTFREDLFYRLNVLPVKLPALRERAGDVPLLVSYYIDQFNREFRKRVKGVSSEALKMLNTSPWAGNVRELRNVVERAMLLTDGAVLQPEDFQLPGSKLVGGDGFRLPPEGVRLDELERDFVVQALQRSGWNQTRAAALLGLNRDQIRYRIEKFGITREEAVGEA